MWIYNFIFKRTFATTMYNVDGRCCFLVIFSPTPNGILSTDKSSINVYLNTNISQCKETRGYLILEQVTELQKTKYTMRISLIFVVPTSVYKVVFYWKEPWNLLFYPCPSPCPFLHFCRH